MSLSELVDLENRRQIPLLLVESRRKIGLTENDELHYTDEKDDGDLFVILFEVLYSDGKHHLQFKNRDLPCLLNDKDLTSNQPISLGHGDIIKVADRFIRYVGPNGSIQRKPPPKPRRSQLVEPDTTSDSLDKEEENIYEELIEDHEQDDDFPEELFEQLQTPQQMGNLCSSYVTRELLTHTQLKLSSDETRQIFKAFQDMAVLNRDLLASFIKDFYHQLQIHSSTGMVRSIPSPVICVLADLLRFSMEPLSHHIIWMKLLSALSHTKTNVQIFVENMVPATVMGSMAARPGSEDIQQCGCEILANMTCYESKEKEKAPVRHTGVELVVAAIRNHGNNIDVLHPALHCLANLSEVMTSLVDKIESSQYNDYNATVVLPNCNSLLRCLRKEALPVTEALLLKFRHDTIISKEGKRIVGHLSIESDRAQRKKIVPIVIQSSINEKLLAGSILKKKVNKKCKRKSVQFSTATMGGSATSSDSEHETVYTETEIREGLDEGPVYHELEPSEKNSAIENTSDTSFHGKQLAANRTPDAVDIDNLGIDQAVSEGTDHYHKNRMQSEVTDNYHKNQMQSEVTDNYHKNQMKSEVTDNYHKTQMQSEVPSNVTENISDLKQSDEENIENKTSAIGVDGDASLTASQPVGGGDGDNPCVQDNLSIKNSNDLVVNIDSKDIANFGDSIVGANDNADGGGDGFVHGTASSNQDIVDNQQGYYSGYSYNDSYYNYYEDDDEIEQEPIQHSELTESMRVRKRIWGGDTQENAYTHRVDNMLRTWKTLAVQVSELAAKVVSGRNVNDGNDSEDDDDENDGYSSLMESVDMDPVSFLGTEGSFRRIHQGNHTSINKVLESSGNNQVMGNEIPSVNANNESMKSSADPVEVKENFDKSGQNDNSDKEKIDANLDEPQDKLDDHQMKATNSLVSSKVGGNNWRSSTFELNAVFEKNLKFVGDNRSSTIEDMETADYTDSCQDVAPVLEMSAADLDLFNVNGKTMSAGRDFEDIYKANLRRTSKDSVKIPDGNKKKKSRLGKFFKKLKGKKEDKTKRKGSLPDDSSVSQKITELTIDNETNVSSNEAPITNSKDGFTSGGSNLGTSGSHLGTTVESPTGVSTRKCNDIDNVSKAGNSTLFDSGKYEEILETDDGLVHEGGHLGTTDELPSEVITSKVGKTNELIGKTDHSTLFDSGKYEEILETEEPSIDDQLTAQESELMGSIGEYVMSRQSSFRSSFGSVTLSEVSFSEDYEDKVQVLGLRTLIVDHIYRLWMRNEFTKAVSLVDQPISQVIRELSSSSPLYQHTQHFKDSDSKLLDIDPAIVIGVVSVVSKRKQKSKLALQTLHGAEKFLNISHKPEHIMVACMCIKVLLEGPLLRKARKDDEIARNVLQKLSALLAYKKLPSKCRKKLRELRNLTRIFIQID